jgi:hypothetical protein
LGVKDLLWFNLALLAKWRWRLLTNHGSLWKRVLGAKYGEVGGHNLSLGRGYKLSLWWKDLIGLGVLSGVEGDWVQEVFVKVLGDGGGTKFWREAWVGRESLCLTFPRLFKIALHPESSVKEMGEWVNESWHWRLEWRRNFLVWEEDLFLKLLELIALANISRKEDSWSFLGGGEFTVNLMYNFLYNRFSPPSSLVLASAGSLAKVWRSSAPTKVIVFSWQALLGRLPTRSNLARRGVVLVGGSTCVFCGLFDEAENHLFASCLWVWSVWLKVFKWFRVVPVLPHSMTSIFETFRALASGRKFALQSVLMVWHAVIWALWRSRNDRIFANNFLNQEEIFYKIRISSWKWLLAKKNTLPCLFYEWCIDPFDCISR